MTISPADLVRDLENRGVRFALADGRLRVLAPKNVLTEDLQQQLRGCREEIVELLGDRRADQETGEAPPVRRVGRDRGLPLSFARQRLWFLDQLDPGSNEYYLPSLIRLGGDVDGAALGAALAGVVARHEVLRTRLVAGADGVAHQVIDPPSPVPLPVADVSGEADSARALGRLVGQDSAVPFDLAGGPLIRALLVRLGAAGHVLVLSMHHVVFDEWSGRILRRELSALYAAFQAGEPDPLPPLLVQYADFAVWQREHLTGEILDRQLEYWRDQLAAVPALELPADRPRPPVRSAEGAALQFSVPAEVSKRLRVLSRERGVTMFMTLLAAFAVVLGRYCGVDDVVVGAPVANRNRAETEDRIGFFINTLVMRTDLSGDPSFAELLVRVREMALAAYAHQDLPFEQLVDALVSERDRSRTPLFQVQFNYTPHGLGDGGSGIDAPRTVSLRELPVKFDLSMALSDAAGGGLAGSIQYGTVLFDETTVERMTGHLVTVLQAVAADAGQPVSRLPVVTEAERHELVAVWNDTEAPVLAAGGVHELIADRAAANPDAIAVLCDESSLSYEALVARARQLAGCLHDMGVTAESVVGLCLPRGVDVVIAMLAVWLAGGAYLPLDLEHPRERLEFMLADSNVRVLVSRRDVGVAGELTTDNVVYLDDAITPGAPPVRTATDPEQLAYVIYTSGSTGTPKGVQVPHRGLLNYVAWPPEAARRCTLHWPST